MWVIISLIVILAFIVGLFSKFQKKDIEGGITEAVPDSDCCGAHEVCEKDLYLSGDEGQNYFEDEELDRFKGFKNRDYDDEDIEEFRDVLLTLKDTEVSKWLKGLYYRGIEIPDVVREEALLVADEARSL